MKIFIIFIYLIIYTHSTYSGVKESSDNLDNIKTKIKTIDKEIIDKKAEQKEIDTNIKKQDKKISSTRKEIHNINKKSKQNKKKLTKLEKNQKVLTSEIKINKQYLSEFIRDIHKKGDISYLKSIIEGKNPSAIVRDEKLQSFYTIAQIELINKLHKKSEQLKETKKIIKKTIKKVDNLKKDKTKIQKKLENEKLKKKKILASVKNEIKNKEQIKKKLVADEKELKKIIDNLVKKATNDEKIKQATKIVKKNKSSEKITPVPLEGGTFNKLKGKLNLPVKGKIKYKFGTKRKDTGIKWKGIFISAKEGSEVKAIANGKVAYADWLRGFGNLIIIDHGKGYMSLYGYNESVLLNVNDDVKTGESVATVGNSGGIGISGLYYELRKDSKPFNPIAWTKK
jgi:septal ring factor EnvC (AmiA/AmiB activator)